MRRLLLLVIPVVVFSDPYIKIIEDIENSGALKSALMLERAALHTEEAAKGKNLPTLDLYFEGAWLKDTPTVTFRIPGSPPLQTPMGTRRNFSGSLRLAYPVFAGYAISAAIKKAGFEHEIAKLKKLDLERNLYLQATELAGAVYAADRRLNALKSAKKAMTYSYEKAKGLYENGLLPPSDLYNIEAKKHSVEAEITDAESQKEQLLNRLGHLLNRDIDSVELPVESLSIPIDKETITDTALRQREDISALMAGIEVDRSVEEVAKSRLYPTLTVAAELKRHGDTLSLNGDGYTNPDQSYIGAFVSWNLFDGFSDKNDIEAARCKRVASKIALDDYKKRVKREISNAFLELFALISRLDSAKMELKAQKAYCDLTVGRFENQLVSADELSRSIADLSAAQAKVSTLKSMIFVQRAKIWLMAGLEPFKENFLKHHDL